MLTDATLSNIKAIWPDVLEYIDREYQITLEALVSAESVDTLRMLQGKAKSFRQLKTLPATLENQLKLFREAQAK